MIQIGTSEYRERVTPIFVKEQDRLRHTYIIGKTGSGKSTLMANMCLQDMVNGDGTCFIDPHGESVDWLISRVPKNRIDDVILLDPSNTDFPFGLNLLEAKTELEQDFLVGECINIFYKLFDPDKTGVIGPQFEHWMRNAALTVMADPEGGTILEIPKLFVDKKFELRKRRFVKDGLVENFWSKQMDATADFHRSEMLNYFSSKFGSFMNTTLMRNILGQKKSTVNIENAINSNKILLVNLSKGKIGENNAYMLGLILIAKIHAGVMKRAGIKQEQRLPYFLYVDEFQTMITDTFASMLAESRKYGLGLHLANQYISQLPAEIRGAIIGNVGSLISFTVGQEDAEFLAKEFFPLKKEDFLKLERRSFYIKLMIDGKSSDPFSGKGLAPIGEEDNKTTAMIKTVSELAYGLPRFLVESQMSRNI
jgi:hypothetical protein